MPVTLDIDLHAPRDQNGGELVRTVEERVDHVEVVHVTGGVQPD